MLVMIPQAFMSVDCADPPVSIAAMEIWTPQALTSGVRTALDAFREALEDLTKTSLARVFRVGELWNSLIYNILWSSNHFCSDINHLRSDKLSAFT